MGILDAPAVNPLAAKPKTIPAGLGWDTSAYPLTMSLVDIAGTMRAHGVSSLTPKSAFDAASTARTAPGATFYVSTTGSDAAAGTAGAPFATIRQGTLAANAAGVPTKVIVDAGTYTRLAAPNNSSAFPTVDIAYVARGGRVKTGTFDTFTAPTLDATQTNCYTISVSAGTVNRVMDILNRNRFGNYAELTQVSTAALCNALPGSWAHIAGTLYIHRADKSAVTTANTRYYRSSAASFRLTNATNVYIGGQSGNDGWDVEGGHANGVLSASIATQTADKVLAVENSTFRYGGGAVDTVGRGVSIGEWRGLQVFQNCRADANLTDGFNFHDTVLSGRCFVLTINCTGADNGRPLQASNNGHTLHEDVVAIDVAGFYEEAHGGAIRNIDNSKALYVGTCVKNDRGDVNWGGSVEPTAFRTDGSAVIWCDRTRVDMPGGSYGYVAGSSGAAVHKRDVWPLPHPDSALGTVDTY